MLHGEPNQLLWQSLHMADTTTLLSGRWWKRPDSYGNGHRKEAVIIHEVLTLVSVVVVNITAFGLKWEGLWRAKHCVNMCQWCQQGAATWLQPLKGLGEVLQSEAQVQVVEESFQTPLTWHKFLLWSGLFFDNSTLVPLKPQMFELQSKIFFYLCKLTKQASRRVPDSMVMSRPTSPMYVTCACFSACLCQCCLVCTHWYVQGHYTANYRPGMLTSAYSVVCLMWTCERKTFPFLVAPVQTWPECLAIIRRTVVGKNLYLLSQNLFF